MTLNEVRSILKAKVLCGEELLDTQVLAACGSDFMSDVLAYVKNQALLLTGLVNPQVIRTADMMDMKCIVFVRGKLPDEGMVTLARQRGIVVMASSMPMYPACGELYLHGLRGSGKPE